MLLRSSGRSPARPGSFTTRSAMKLLTDFRDREGRTLDWRLENMGDERRGIPADDPFS